MKRLIINADDFGLTVGVTTGIVESILRGAVCSTSAMCCRPEFLENIARQMRAVEGRIGVHLQLTDGIPCCESGEVASLVNERGEFPRSRRDMKPLCADDVRREWRAQIERVLSLGIRPAHLDTHHHVHVMPVAFDVYCELAATYRLPARTMTKMMTERLRARGVSCADYCETGWYGGGLTPETLTRHVLRAFAQLGGEGTIELMCHPGVVDEELKRRSKYVSEREDELRALCAPELPQLLSEAGVELITASALSGASPQAEPLPAQVT